MAAVRPPTADFRDPIQDSRRWDRFEHRPDDIFISTPPKSGTTWMQGIMSSMLWPAGDAPDTLQDRSPWVDVRFAAEDEMLENLASRQHRRFIKTHSPADCTPIFEECRYVVVYRDGRDALMSWANHRRAMRADVVDFLNSTAEAEGIEPIPRSWDGDMDALFDEWATMCSSIQHLASWWPLRREPFVLFVHYNDLTSDLEGEMRRIAAFCGIDVPDDLWGQTVRRCSLDDMREAARAEGRVELAFEGGADAFFNKGTNGRWHGVLTDAQLARFDRLVADGLEPDAANWLETGSLEAARRPSEI